MRQHESSAIISAGARAVLLIGALLVSSAVDSSRANGAPSSVWNAQRIRRVIDEGTHVVLTDGTVWEVYLPDRPAVNMWKAGDLLIVREAAVMQGEYDYTLRDGRTRKPVSARLVGDLSSRS